MTPRRRLGLALLCLTPALGCFDTCGGGGGPPETRTCADEDASYAVDSISVSAAQEFGGQGTTMFVFDVELEGADPPECARIDYEYSDARGTIRSSTILVSTDEGPEGRRIAQDIWDPWPGSESDVIRVDVTAAGQSAFDCAVGSCDALEGDAGTDAGASDAGAEDAGASDAGASDAGPDDAGPDDDAGA